MENTLHKKLRRIQAKYPAPSSQSWSNSNPAQDMSDKMKKCPSLQENKNKLVQPQYGCCWKRPKPLTRGCDPYAPHLKYGLFPRKVIQDFTKSMPNKLVPSKKMSFEDIQLNNMVEKYNRGGKKSDNKGQLFDAPLFRIRPVNKQYARQLQLSMSKVTHVDIKPRKNVPPKRNESPPGSLSPRKICNRLIRNK